MPSEPLPPTLSVLDPFRPELASPPVVPPPSPLDDIPLELVPVPMPRPERPPVAERVRPSQPRRAEAANRAGPTAAENSAATREPAAEPGGKDQAGRKRAERRERGGETAAPAKAQAAGSAARSASSAGAVASYARKVNGHLQRHKRYPAEAARQKLKGAVRLAVTIDRGGRLLGVRVSAGSGHAALDRAALATAKRASPYPSPPQGVGGRSLTLAFTLRYGR